MISEQHENLVKQKLKELAEKGYKTINLEHKIPDGIAIKDNKLYAIEILLRRKRKGRADYRLDGGWTYRQKRRLYSMFDEVKIYTYDKEDPKKILTER